MKFDGYRLQFQSFSTYHLQTQTGMQIKRNKTENSSNSLHTSPVKRSISRSINKANKPTTHLLRHLGVQNDPLHAILIRRWIMRIMSSSFVAHQNAHVLVRYGRRCSDHVVLVILLVCILRIDTTTRRTETMLTHGSWLSDWCFMALLAQTDYV